MVVLQYVFFERTLLGKKMQATSQDKEMASLLGIPVALMIMMTFIYSALLGGLAGMLVAPILFVSVGMGSRIALKAFAASIIGGFGNVTGAIVGGLALGVVETFGAAYISVPYKDAFAFLVLFVFCCSARRAFSAKGSRKKHECHGAAQAKSRALSPPLSGVGLALYVAAAIAAIAALLVIPLSGLLAQPADAGLDLRDRRVRPHRSCSAMPARSTSRRRRFSGSAPTAWRSARRCSRCRSGSRSVVGRRSRGAWRARCSASPRCVSAVTIWRW